MNFRVGKREPAEACSEKFGLRKVANRKFTPLETAVAEDRTPQAGVGETGCPEARKGEVEILPLATFEQQVMARRLGEVRAREFAIHELHPMKTASRQVGIRKVAVPEEHVRPLRTEQRSACKMATRKAARLDRQMLAAERHEIRTPKHGIRDLLRFMQQQRIAR